MSKYPFIKVGNKFLHFYSEWSIMKLIPINMKGFINSFINSFINIIKALYSIGCVNTNIYKERQNI